MRPDDARWRSTPALARSVLLPVVLAATGLAVGRVDLVVLGIPLVLGTALALGGRRHPRTMPRVRAIGPRIVELGDTTKIAVQVEASEAQLVTTVLPPAAPGDAGDRIAVQAPAETDRQIVTETTPPSWGTHPLARPDHLVVGEDGLYSAGPMTAIEYTAHVLPSVRSALPPGPLPPRPAGMVGAHPTRRPGEGTELHDVSPFAPGDRLRRVDWRVTARQSGPREELYTRRTQVDSDADVVCCLDNRFDLRSDVALWSESFAAHAEQSPPRGSVDVAVDTVTSVAASYISNGDRVGVLDLSRPTDVARLGSGSRHLLRLRTYLARHTHRPGTADGTSLPRRTPRFPPGAIVIVTSVFMDDSIAVLAATWRRAGHPVLAVDVLPTPALDGADRETTLAARVVLAERDERLRSLTSSGVLVSRAEPAELALSLTTLRRMPGRSRR